MKNIVPLLSLVVLSQLCHLNIQAQVPQSINYQAIARNTSGNALANQIVGLRFTIRDGSSGGAIVYREVSTDSTNQFGLFTSAIGTGTVVNGTFSGINWGTGNKYLQVEIDVTGGTTYSDMGTAQLLSVPYALYAGNSLPGSTGPQGPTGELAPQAQLESKDLPDLRELRVYQVTLALQDPRGQWE
jgi:hypothetical protein